MFIGHALLAFALAVLIAEWRGYPAHRALALGIATGAFAALPDVDILYAVFALNPAEFVAGTDIRPGAFWGAANGVHRSMTHSLVIAAFAGSAFGLWTRKISGRAAPNHGGRRSTRWRSGSAVVSVAVLGVLVVLSGLVTGAMGVFVMGAFVLAGITIASLARSRLGLTPREIGLSAVAGLASHPWGDLVTGEPPALLYPLDAAILHERILLSSDPTVHLLGAFAIELAVISLAALVLARSLGFRPFQLVDRRAVLGALYGGSAVLMVPPTIDISYHFVFSILAIGVVCGGVPRSRWVPSTIQELYVEAVRDPETALRTTVTALAGIAVALVSYAAVYLVLV